MSSSNTTEGREAAPKLTGLIDTHHHIVLPEYESAIARAGATDFSRPLRKNTDAQEEIDSMAALGIVGAVVNPLSVAGVHHGDDADAQYLTRSVNDALAKFSSRSPNTFGFFGTLPFPDQAGSLRELEHCMDKLNADGVILLSHQNGTYVGDAAFDELYGEMNRRSAAVFVHPTRPDYLDKLKLDLWPALIEYTFETTRVAMNLIYNGVMDRYPNIRWILAHGGGCLPYVTLRTELLTELDKNMADFRLANPDGLSRYFRQFWYDTAIAASPPALAALYQVADPSHIMFGSDWPYLNQKWEDIQVETLATSDTLTPRWRELMIAENAAALFPRFARRG